MLTPTLLWRGPRHVAGTTTATVDAEKLIGLWYGIDEDSDSKVNVFSNTTRLVVDFPFVVDYCNNAYYNILNGQIVISEEQNMVPNFSTELVYPLFQYHTNYDGNKLVITN